jgi:hypothetical protein
VVAPADEVGGQYCENCHVGKIVPDDVTITAVGEGVRSYALDPKNAEALWKKSEEMVEVTPFFVGGNIEACVYIAEDTVIARTEKSGK